MRPSILSDNPLRAPAIALLMLSILSILMFVASMSLGIWMLSTGSVEEMEDQNALVESKETVVVIRFGVALFLVLLHAIVIFGAISMIRMRNYALSYAIAVISVIPCCSGCYLLGIPFGIWALAVLNREDVKAAFR